MQEGRPIVAEAAGGRKSEAPATPANIHSDPRYQLAVRVAESHYLQKAPRLKELLLYVCEQTLLGQSANLTEQKIGHRIFNRRADYSPADDSIVRVEARQLRLRLTEYFGADGQDEPIVIEIPRGSYVAQFHPSGVTGPAPQLAGTGHPSRTTILLGLISGAVIAVLAVSCVLLFLQNRRLREAAGLSAPGRHPLILDLLFDNGRPTDVIMPDSGFGLIHDRLGGALTLEDYLRPGYPDSLTAGLTPADEAWARLAAERPYVVFSQVLLADRLARLSTSRGWRYSFRHARDLHTRDLAEGNHILLGGHMSNPWMSLFEDKLIFRQEWSASDRVGRFRNVAPIDGEQPVYLGGGRNGMPGSAFGAIALLPNGNDPAKRERVLLIRGTNMEAVEAAWDYAAEPVQEPRVAAQIRNLARGTELNTAIEVLLETRALAGSHGQVTVRSVRIH